MICHYASGSCSQWNGQPYHEVSQAYRLIKRDQQVGGYRKEAILTTALDSSARPRDLVGNLVYSLSYIAATVLSPNPQTLAIPPSIASIYTTSPGLYRANLIMYIGNPEYTTSLLRPSSLFTFCFAKEESMDPCNAGTLNHGRNGKTRPVGPALCVRSLWHQGRYQTPQSTRFFHPCHIPNALPQLLRDALFLFSNSTAEREEREERPLAQCANPPCHGTNGLGISSGSGIGNQERHLKDVGSLLLTTVLQALTLQHLDVVHVPFSVRPLHHRHISTNCPLPSEFVTATLISLGCSLDPNLHCLRERTPSFKISVTPRLLSLWPSPPHVLALASSHPITNRPYPFRHAPTLEDTTYLPGTKDDEGTDVQDAGSDKGDSVLPPIITVTSNQLSPHPASRIPHLASQHPTPSLPTPSFS
ncbi:hypothetical protein NMY22_g1683 [Coprinellus aureogranulatus]|nr:hypothetical protein NMY22_g1683 [Coprinellus aureogranulatus]